MAARNGQLGRLRKYHPKYFRKLMIKTEMGKILLEAKKVKSSFDKKSLKIKSDNIGYIIKRYPDYFDCF